MSDQPTPPNDATPTSDATQSAPRPAVSDSRSKSTINLDKVAPQAPGHGENTANQSLADALKTSFLVLKIVMFGLVVFYLVSGYTTIKNSEAGIKISLGKADPQALGPGPHFTWPFPFQSVERVPTSPQDATVNRAFYYENSKNTPISDLKFSLADLNPEKDGSLIAGDGGIVHAKIGIKYAIEDPYLFVQHVGLAEVGTEDAQGRLITDKMVNASRLVESVLEQSMVELAAQVDSDQFTVGQNLVEQARVIVGRLGEKLEAYGIGLDLSKLTITDKTVSPSVVDAYTEKNSAEQERDQALSRATESRTKLLTEAAGRLAADALSQMIDDYEDLAALPDKDQEAQALYDQIMAAYKARQLPESYGSHAITGEVARMVSQAEAKKSAYLSQFVQAAQAFEAYIQTDDFKKNPDLVKARLKTDLLRELFSGELSEIYVLPKDSALELWLNRDPELVRQIEQAQINAKAEAEAQNNP